MARFNAHFELTASFLQKPPSASTQPLQAINGAKLTRATFAQSSHFALMEMHTATNGASFVVMAVCACTCGNTRRASLQVSSNRFVPSHGHGALHSDANLYLSIGAMFANVSSALHPPVHRNQTMVNTDVGRPPRPFLHSSEGPHTESWPLSTNLRNQGVGSSAVKTRCL